MIADEVKTRIKNDLRYCEQHGIPWTPWRRILPGELDKPIGCVYKACKLFATTVTYQVASGGHLRLCACADHADHEILQQVPHKKYRYHVPLHVGMTGKPKDRLFTKAELRKIQRYDFQIGQRTEYVQRAKAGDTEAYALLQNIWHVRLPLLEQQLRKLGHWPDQEI